MAKFTDYSIFTAFRDAIGTIAGWTATILGTIVLGVWLGMSVSGGEVVPFGDVFPVLLLLPFVWMMSLNCAVGVAVSSFAWYLPLKIESHRLMIAAVCVNFSAWFAITISVL